MFDNKTKTKTSVLVFVSGILAGAALFALVAAGLSHPGSDAGENSPIDWAEKFLPELQAELADGDYLFFPNRRNIWVVHPQTGRLMHYKFLDTPEATVEKSRVARVNAKLFPPEDTSYVLSERNITDLLWVCNRRTGAFQLWRRNVRDGSLVTDPLPVMASDDIFRSSRP